MWHVRVRAAHMAGLRDACCAVGHVVCWRQVQALLAGTSAVGGCPASGGAHLGWQRGGHCLYGARVHLGVDVGTCQLVLQPAGRSSMGVSMATSQWCSLDCRIALMLDLDAWPCMHTQQRHRYTVPQYCP
jgi:hypothetical protein